MFLIRILILIIALNYSVSAQDLKSIIDSVNNLPVTEYLANLYKSKTIFEENLNRTRSINYKIGEAKTLNILAIIYYLMGNYEKSTEFNIQSFKILKKKRITMNLPMLMVSMVIK
jgi:hypothetical protein